MHSYRAATAFAVFSQVTVLKRQAKDPAGAWDQGGAFCHFDKNPPRLGHVIILLPVEFSYACGEVTLTVTRAAHLTQEEKLVCL